MMHLRYADQNILVNEELMGAGFWVWCVLRFWKGALVMVQDSENVPKLLHGTPGAPVNKAVCEMEE